MSSAEKFMDDIKREKPVDAKMANQIRNMFRYKFCKGFFEKNGRWPVVHLLDDVRDDIVTSVKGGQWLERGGDAWRANDFNMLFSNCPNLIKYTITIQLYTLYIYIYIIKY